MSDGLRILGLYGRQHADVTRMVVVRPGPRGQVIVRPECSADELQAVADRPFEVGAQVLVASAQGASSTLRVLGSLPSGLSGTAAVTAVHRGRLTGTAPTIPPFCPAFRPAPLWALLGSSTQIALYSYDSGDPLAQSWVVDLEGDWGPITTSPWPADIRRNGDVALIQPAALLSVATIKGGSIKRWDMGIEGGVDGFISRPAWDGERVAVAVRRETAATIYRWNGSTNVAGIPPSMAWMEGPPDLPAGLSGVEIAIGQGGQVFYAEGNSLWHRAGTRWIKIEGVTASDQAERLCVVDHRTVLAGEWRIDLGTGIVAHWAPWGTDTIGADIPRAYSIAGGAAVLGYPFRTDTGDTLMSVDLPPAGAKWGNDCEFPTVNVTAPAGWSIAAVGAK